MSAGAGLPVAAEWQIQADDPETAWEVAGQFKAIADAVLIGIRLGNPVADAAEILCERPVCDLVASRSARVEYIRWLSPAWKAVMADSVRWSLAVDLDALPLAPVEPDEPYDTLFPKYPEVVDPDSAAVGLRLVGCRVRLASSDVSPSSTAVSALFSVDSRGVYGLQCLPVVGRHQAMSWMPVDLAAHLLAAPARIGGEFPSSTTQSSGVFEHMESAATPHVLILGPSGSGKSVFLANWVERAASDGEASVVVEAQDGWLKTQVLASALRHGRDPIVADFSDPASAPRVNLATPPNGVDAHRWADDLFDVVRRVLHADEPSDHFGKVGERLLRAVLKVPILDPFRMTRFEDLPLLLNDPQRDADRHALLQLINDMELTGVIERELVPMIRRPDPANAAAWLFSGIQPLTSCWAFRGAEQGQSDTLGVEQAVENGRPFVLYAPAAVLGDTGTRLLVTVTLHRLWLACRRQRNPVARPVFVDEWQLYPSPTIEAMLSQGRKYGIKLRLANQNLAQVPNHLRESALGNTGSVICFRVGPADAALIDDRFPTISRATLQTLPKHTLAATFGDIDLVVPAPPPPA